jgi:hypothetical protein
MRLMNLVFKRIDSATQAGRLADIEIDGLYRPGARLCMLMAAPRRPVAASITRGHLRKTLRSWSARAVTIS